MAEHITFGERLTHFTASAVDVGFGIEQGFFFANFLFGAIAAASIGAGGLALVSLLLAIAPARALVREFQAAGNNLQHATRRKGGGGGHH